LSQLFNGAVTQSRLNLNPKTTKITLNNDINTHHLGLSVAFSFTIIGLNNKRKQNNLTEKTRQKII